MEGRSAEGVVVTLGPARGQAEESELNGWLIDTHFAEVMASGVFNHAVRLVNPEATPGSVEGTANDIDAKTTKFLTVYETSRADVAAAWRENTARNADLREQGRITQISPHSSTSMVAAFKRVAAPHGSGARTTGILAVMMDFKDAAERQAFQPWYGDVHIPEILATGLYHTATRYQSDPLQPGHPEFMTLYETDREDVAATLKQFTKALRDLSQSPRKFDLTMRFWAPFEVLHSASGSGKR